MIHLARLGVPVDFSTFLGKGSISAFIEGRLRESGAAYRNIYQGSGEPVHRHQRIDPAHGPQLRLPVRGHCVHGRDEAGPAGAIPRGEDPAPWGWSSWTCTKQLKKENPGVILVLDESWRDDLSLSRYGDYLALADYYTPNHQEAQKITGQPTPEKALEALAPYLRASLVKVGDRGCLVMEEGQITQVPTLPLEGPVVDTTGAGDAFIAGLMYGLYHDAP